MGPGVLLVFLASILIAFRFRKLYERAVKCGILYINRKSRLARWLWFIHKFSTSPRILGVPNSTQPIELRIAILILISSPGNS